MGFLRKNRFIEKKVQLRTTKATQGKNIERKERYKRWITYYRRNWDIFCAEVLGIKLYPLQKMKIHMMGISNTYFDIACRGTAKSFIVGVGALCAFCLYSYQEIVITSSTIPQACKLVEKKIRDEIIKKLSPYLLDMYKKDYIVIKKSDEGGYIIENKLNGSTISVVGCLDSSRGIRATMFIGEETRLLKKNIIDSVFLPMLHNRPAPYTLDKAYQTSRWIEAGREIYITSSGYEWEWFIRSFRKCVEAYYTNTHEVYIPMGMDIFAAIEEGSRTWADYRKAKKNMAQMEFSIEILNQVQGSTEDAFFDLRLFKEGQILEQCYVPPTDFQVMTRTQPKFRPKEPNEVRIIGVDYAFANTTKLDHDNDNTIIECISAIWKGNYFERHVDYIEQHPASDSTGAQWRVRELFWDYCVGDSGDTSNCYIVNDQRLTYRALQNVSNCGDFLKSYQPNIYSDMYVA